MPCISEQTIVEKVKDVIYETGLMSPRSAISMAHRFKEDYGLSGKGPLIAFTTRVNDQFEPYGIGISVDAMSACVRVSDLVATLHAKCAAIAVVNPVLALKARARRNLATRKSSRAGAQP